MSAGQIRSLYAAMPDRLARSRRKFGRGLALAEKIFIAHCHDFESQEWFKAGSALNAAQAGGSH